MDYEALGGRIKTYRKINGLTQAELAEKTGLSISYIGHIEHGTRSIGVDILVKIANALNVTSDALLCDSLLHRDFSLDYNQKKNMLLMEIMDVLTDE